MRHEFMQDHKIEPNVLCECDEVTPRLSGDALHMGDPAEQVAELVYTCPAPRSSDAAIQVADWDHRD